MDLEKIYNKIKNSKPHQGNTVNLGDILELVVTEECVDIYKYVDPYTVDDDYDFDSDYLTTIYME